MIRSADDGAELCHINLARGFRGGERQTELLIRALAAHVPRQRLIFRAGAPLGARLADVQGLQIVAARSRIAAALASRDAALIHAHETGAAQAALVHSWFSPTPYVITRRVDNVPTSTFVTRRMYRRAAIVVALSSAIREVMHAYDPRLKLRVIPDACSDLPFDAARTRAHRNRFPGKFLVGHIAAFDFAHKGQDYLLEAAARIEQTHPEIHFILVGSGRDAAALRALASGRPNVTIEGWTDNVGDYLAAFDLFALPSNREGLGSILLDAMQFGLPIVATQAGGIPDVVEPGKNGLLVPARDAGALADAILRLFSDPALRNAMSQINKRKMNDYRPSIMAQRYLGIYTELVPQLGSARGAR